MTLRPIRLLIVDDEPLARLRLRQLVGDVQAPRAEIVGEAADAAEALRLLDALGCDAVLLDVQMPGADGTQLAGRIRDRGAEAPAVIFVTAHAQHALKAFELQALDYLTKPVRRERLQAALQRVAQRVLDRDRQRGFEAGIGQDASASSVAAPAEEPVIVVSDRGRIVRVRLDEVLYLKAELKYVTLRTARHSYVLDEPLTDLEPRLGPRFLRVHRNALVAKRAVRVLERRYAAPGGEDDGSESWVVQLDGAEGEWIAVSRRQLGAVREALQAAGS